MFRAIRRSFSKRRAKTVNLDIDLDGVSNSLLYRTRVGHIFDPNKSNEGHHLLQYILLLGPTSSESKEASVLFAYPTHHLPTENMERIIQFCYPTGVYSSNVENSSIVSQFVFGLNDGGSLQFGICSHLSFKKENWLSSTRQVFCICTVSSVSAFSAHFSLHQFLCMQMVNVDLSAPDNNQEGLSPLDLTENTSTEIGFGLKPIDGFPFAAEYPLINGGNSIPTNFLKTVQFYYQIKLTDSLQNYKLDDTLSIYIPSQKDVVKEISRECFDMLFHSLSIQNIVRYFRSVLLEQRVLLISDDISKLTLCTLAALPMVSPMNYQGAILPLLPDSDDFLDYLDTPVPFVFGALNTPKLRQHSLTSDMTIIYLDSDSISFNEEIPHMPNAQFLRKKLTSLIKSMEVVVPPPELQAKFWIKRQNEGLPIMYKIHAHMRYSFRTSDSDMIADLFHNFVEQFVARDRLLTARVRDTSDSSNPVCGFVKEIYMIDSKPEECEFLEDFIATQTFMTYFDHILE